ncbi:MAG TPA: DoxX family protein [Ktedonobacteraceae bacterium]
MFIAYTLIAILLSFVLVGSGVAKLRRNPAVVHGVHEVVGVPLRMFLWLATCEFLGAAGLLIGIAWWPLGLAAAIGVVLYFVSASIGHLRVRDFKGLPGAAVILLIAIAVLVVRSLSLS